MKSNRRGFRAALALFTGTALLAPYVGAQSVPPDPGWPRVYKKNGQQLTVYQPQVDSWKDYKSLHFRSAVAVSGGGLKGEKFGVVEVEAVTVANLDARVVAVAQTKRDIRFQNLAPAEEAIARQIVDQLRPMSQVVTLSLDRVLAYVDPKHQPLQPTVKVNLEPPKIFYSATPAALVIFMGPPQLKPVAADRKDLMFAVNTNWDVLFDTASSRYYLLDGEGWLTAAKTEGPWTAASKLPASFSTLPKDDNWAEARKRIPGKPVSPVPKVFAINEPAELIVTKGAPTYTPIAGTKLMHVANTESLLFLHSAEKAFYFLVAGRWFRAASLEGPWTAASEHLPPDFVAIPDSDPSAFVKASVPGTQEAKDAVLLASIPNNITVEKKPVTDQVIYSGEPKFEVIQGTTTVQSAVNTPYSVFLVDKTYYWCHEGAWLTSASPTGPWTFATMIPAAIYTIPPTHVSYNVTYVTVQQSTPTTVTYSQTSGYSGEYVAATGVVMFGMGVLVGAAMANNSYYYYHYPYYYPPAVHYSYGMAATYHYGYGGYYSAAHVYGPYGGAGRAAGYNPATGTYARSAYAYGPYGSAHAAQAYNPYTGTRAQGAAVNTAYGSAARGAAYNPYTGASAAGRSVQTAYGSAGGFYAQKGGEAAWGGYRSGDYGSAAGVRTTQGTGAVAWDTENSQGAAARTRSGDVYAGSDGTVYKKDSSGSWSSNSGSGWQSMESPSSQAQANAQQRSSELQGQAQARASGNQRAQSASQYRASGSRSYSGGGGRRR